MPRTTDRAEQQLLNHIQSSTNPRPDAICSSLLAPPPFPRLRGPRGRRHWVVVLNRDATTSVSCAASSMCRCFRLRRPRRDRRIQGRQSPLCCRWRRSPLHSGSKRSSAAKQRHFGALEAKPRPCSCVFSKHSGPRPARQSVIRGSALSTSRDSQIAAVCAQDIPWPLAPQGFRRCIPERRDQWEKIPFLGCDGLPRLDRNGCAAVS